MKVMLGSAAATILAACGGSAAPASAPPSSAAPASSAAAAASAKPATSAAASAPASAAAPASSAAAAASANPAASAAASAAANIKTGGTLKIGQVGDIITTDGFQWSPVQNNTIGQVFDVLTLLDDNLQPVPRLAESWDLSADNKTIKLNLRKGVTYHSGREFTSDDVKYNIMRSKDPNNNYNTQQRTAAGWWTSVDTPDKYTAVLTSDKPRPGVFDFFMFLRLTDKDTADGGDKSKVIGTGPLKFQEWSSGDHVSFVKNPNYWQSGKPYLDGMRVQVFKDQASMVAALEAGAIDVADLVPIPDAVRLQNDKNYKFFDTWQLGQFFYYMVNANVAPTDNKLFRQGIAHAIDRQRFTDTVMKSLSGMPRDLPWADKSPAFEASKNNLYDYDLDKAA
ncbi:MAG: ABC transporter substrate-binding protein, partial [Chloroflexi bacterium]|nr:ABC transporter substrate-binding protein [Chloroflexota bacterium]